MNLSVLDIQLAAGSHWCRSSRWPRIPKKGGGRVFTSAADAAKVALRLLMVGYARSVKKALPAINGDNEDGTWLTTGCRLPFGPRLADLLNDGRSDQVKVG